MSLSRKHYRVIASNIKYCTIKCNNNTRSIINKERLIKELCIEFRKDNSAFNSDVFRDACE